MWRYVLEVCFPPQCGGCDAVGSGWCDGCAAETAPLVEERGALKVRALGAYRGTLRRAILALKDGRRDVASAFGNRLGAHVPRKCSIVPVPTTKARRRVRGMDGVVEIARAASAKAGVQLCDALVHAGDDAQHGRSRSARLAARGRFRATMRLDGRSVVIVDDVCTTGATLLDCAAALRAAGAAVREAVVVAVAPNEHDP